MLTYEQRRERCNQTYWMKGTWLVVVQCRKCGQQQNAPVPTTMSLDGKAKLSFCDICGTLSCLPVLKDRVTVAEVG